MKKKIFSIALLGIFSTLSADVISKNGIAKDSVTGLMWQDEPITEVEKTALYKKTNRSKAGDWNYAKTYCENLTLSGFSDWRLPNIYELITLLDNTKSSTPIIINGIENISSFYYWSSTTYASGSSYAWDVDFGYGNALSDYKTNISYVRCVRAGQLNFNNLVILKNKGKVKVSQENIDKISPNAEKIRAQKETQVKSVTTRSYNSWKTLNKYETNNSGDSSQNIESTDIKCEDGTKGYINNFYNLNTSYRYFANGKNSFKTFEEAANYICGN